MKALGPSNDDPPAVQVEMRIAADIASGGGLADGDDAYVHADGGEYFFRPPWNRTTCTLIGIGRELVLAALKPGERPCDGCNGTRASCGGYPRKDGDPR